MELSSEHGRVNSHDAAAFERIFLRQPANIGYQLGQWGRAPYR